MQSRSELYLALSRVMRMRSTLHCRRLQSSNAPQICCSSEAMHHERCDAAVKMTSIPPEAHFKRLTSKLHVTTDLSRTTACRCDQAGSSHPDSRRRLRPASSSRDLKPIIR